ncbi:NAD-dependent epimerase/dehydratase family protein [Ideonella sp. 4Y16]|uniref:NAD-dependent epimerase/dehydratase family protein n=1 Tax=Ideonella alba TaxID=2824118 RepID=UPI001B398D56|nr:NAD-dependent epimerase/dehydratase family protein [Ideonella alba]MBQ0944608.1 NAD-dependent epimerase/dehydratase family protein [Ideonella alba]
MRVLVTGAQGFIGRHLLQRLLRQGLGGRAVGTLLVSDLRLDELPHDQRLLAVPGSIADTGVLERALAAPVDAVFHLASVPGGAAERDPQLGQRVNLDATLRLVDLLRGHGNGPRLVFASTVAVYGDPLPAVVDEATPACPVLSYGAQKLAAEILLADAARRGWVQACSLRLPGVVARPGSGEGLISAFMSQLFWRLRDGQPCELPVSADGTAWWISAPACVDNLVHAATIDPARLPPGRVVQMPALQLSMAEVVEALVQAHGEDRRALVSHRPQAMVQRLFASQPPLHTPRALGLGFRHDGSAAELVRQATVLA